MEHIVIKKEHRSHGKDRWIDRKIHQDKKGLYVKFDSSSWYVEKVIVNGQDAGYYHSIEYRQYHGK